MTPIITENTPRPPIVAVMGHIDHGKSTLLDYIRKTNVTAAEAGGITQHLSAYEITLPHKDSDGNEAMRGITFIDTPGHAAFSGMRERGAVAADIAILVVSAEDGVKAQTIEALNTIRNANIPFVVAINKIDKPNANIDKAKQMLAEQSVLVEGYGGSISWVGVSAVTGEGVADLLETILLVADIEEIGADPETLAEGVVIESTLDAKRGIAATIVLKNGTLYRGQFLVAGTAITTTRIMENFLGKSVEQVNAGSAVRLVGFDQLPEVGAAIKVFAKKRDAENAVADIINPPKGNADKLITTPDLKIVPIIIKADVFGTVEAIEQEIKKMTIEGIHPKIISKGMGAISESDIKTAGANSDTIILGFNTALDARARDINENVHATIQIFSIIYKLTEWLATELEVRRPRKEMREAIGTVKVLKLFSQTKERQVIGCRVMSGAIADGAQVTVLRRDFPIANGKIVELQQAKQKKKEVTEGECGMMVECKNDIAPGDILEAFMFVTK